YVRDDALFLTIKVVSRHQTTQQYGAILLIELTTAKIRNSKAYKEYHACAMGEAAPKPKAVPERRRVIMLLPPLLLLLHQQLLLRVPDVPSDDSEEELSWKSFDDEDVGSHEEGKESDESDDDRDEGSDNDSEKNVKSGDGKDDDDDDDEDDDENDDEEELAKDDE
nr:hypothetical protein [Tanacetum cinerariifolium]